MKMRYFENPTKEEAIELYWNVKEKLRVNSVSLADYSKNGGYPATIIRKLFGSWNEFKSEIGESTKKANNGKEFSNLTQEEVIADYYAVKDRLQVSKLSREKYLENGKYPRFQIKRLFGSWNNFLKEMEEPLLMHRNITNEEIIEIAKRLHIKYGKLTAEIMRREGISQIAVDNRFGSFSAMIKEAGLIQEQIGYTRTLSDEEFLSDLHEIQKEYGYVNATLIINNSKIPYASYLNRYKTLGDACMKAGVRHLGQESVRYSNGMAMTAIKKVAELLQDDTYHTEMTFDWLRNDITGLPLAVDSYFPKHNLVVEYHGHRHFYENFFVHDISFEEIKRRDQLKKDLCSSKGINFVEIPYYDDENVIDYVKSFIE